MQYQPSGSETVKLVQSASSYFQPAAMCFDDIITQAETETGAFPEGFVVKKGW